MRLHALLLAFIVLGARAATLPDKADIEKKLTDAVKEVLDKDKPTPENVSSEQELIDQANGVKEVENNLRKSPQVAAIPVKVVVEDVKPEVRSEPEKKEDNEVSPQSEESIEIKRVEVDLKNPGPPQRMEHDTQNPEHFDDSEQTVILKAQSLNNWWKSTPQYETLQKDLQKLKENFNKQLDTLNESIQNVWSSTSDAEEVEEAINVRASIKQDAGTTAAPGTGGFGSGNGPFASMIQQWQENLSNFNKTVNEYFQNQTAQFQSPNSTNVNGGNNWFNFGNNGNFNFFNQSQPDGAQSDEQRPGFWQSVQNFFSGGTPAGVQSDSQQPAQPNRPVIQAIQSAFQNGVNFFQPNNNKPVEVPAEPEKPAEGGNAVPDSKPDESQKQKPEAAPQAVQSGPIKQIIGNNLIIQGIAGAVQRIQHTIQPEKPREEEVKDEKKDAAVKGGFYKPGGAATGDSSSGSGVAAKNVPVDDNQGVPEKEAEKEEEKAPVVPEKTE